MNMKDLRESKGLTIAAIAQAVGVGESTVRNWEKGRSKPELDPVQYRVLLDLYEVSPSEFESCFRASTPQKIEVRLTPSQAKACDWLQHKGGATESEMVASSFSMQTFRRLKAKGVIQRVNQYGLVKWIVVEVRHE